MIGNGAPMPVVSAVLGHASSDTTQAYYLRKGVSILIPPDLTSRRRTSSTPRQFGSSHVQAGR